MVEDRDSLSNYAKPAKKPADKRSRWTREGMFLSPAFSLCTSVELKLSLRTRLARTSDACETHAKPVDKSTIASLVLRLCWHSSFSAQFIYESGRAPGCLVNSHVLRRRIVC